MTAEIWPGSRLSLEGDGALEAFGASVPDPLVLAFLLLASLGLILLYGRLIAAISGSVTFCRSAYATSETLGNNYLCNAIVQIFLLMVPFYAVALRLAGLGKGYLWADTSFVFWSAKVAGQPIWPSSFEDDFYIAMQKIGISNGYRPFPHRVRKSRLQER